MHKTIELFDFDARWDEVVPFLDHPLVQRALDVGMRGWCHGTAAWWDPKRGPWSYSRGNYWCVEIESRFWKVPGRVVDYYHWGADISCPSWDVDPVGHEAWFDTNEAAAVRYDELTASLEPQPNTPDWYRCIGANYALAPWCCALGTVMFPNRKWVVRDADTHACGCGDGLYMDILMSCSDFSVEEVAAAVRGGSSETLECVLQCREDFLMGDWSR